MRKEIFLVFFVLVSTEGFAYEAYHYQEEPKAESFENVEADYDNDYTEEVCECPAYETYFPVVQDFIDYVGELDFLPGEAAEDKFKGMRDGMPARNRKRECGLAQNQSKYLYMDICF